MLNNFQTIAGATPPITIAPADNGRMYLVDTTVGFGGFYLPPPATFGVGFWGAQKIDDTSNFVQVFTNAQNVNGFDMYVLIVMGDSIVFGCDGTRWTVVSRSEAVPRLFHAHRTPVVSAGNATPYVCRVTDRCVFIRVTADTGNATVVLPSKLVGTDIFRMRNAVPTPPAYFNRFQLCVSRTAASGAGRTVTIMTSDGTSINGAASLVLTQNNELAFLDFDTAEWIAVKWLP